MLVLLDIEVNLKITHLVKTPLLSVYKSFIASVRDERAAVFIAC